MADPNAITKPNRISRDGDYSLNHPFNAGFIPGEQLPDSPSSGDSESSKNSDSDSDNSGFNRVSELAASLRVFSEAMLRMEMADLEMVKAREAARLAAEKRRLETEAELTQLILRTQVQVAAVVTRTVNGRKRKRSSDESAQREGALLMRLLQCNLLI